MWYKFPFPKETADSKNRPILDPSQAVFVGVGECDMPIILHAKTKDERGGVVVIARVS